MHGEKSMESASGYLELGLPEEALNELRDLSPRERMSHRALEMKLEAEIVAERWNAGADTGRLLCMKEPEKPCHFIRAARCLHETGDTAAARDWLLTGPTALIDDPRFHFQIARYHAALGETRAASSHLRRAVEMDGQLDEAARCDENLAAVAAATDP